RTIKTHCNRLLNYMAIDQVLEIIINHLAVSQHFLNLFVGLKFEGWNRSIDWREYLCLNFGVNTKESQSKAQSIGSGFMACKEEDERIRQHLLICQIGSSRQDIQEIGFGRVSG